MNQTNAQTDSYFKVAIQKKGKLNEGSLAYLQDTFQMNFNLSGDELVYIDPDKRLQLVFMRDDDIPQFVNDGLVDMGIVGSNVLMETGYKDDYLPLDFAKCKLDIAVPVGMNYQTAQDLKGQKIATSYPALLKTFLNEQKVKAEIITMTGSVEAAPGAGFADAICDLVETGKTLRQNNLKAVQTIFTSQAVMVLRPELEETYDLSLNNLLLRKQEIVMDARENAVQNTYNFGNHRFFS